MVSRSVSTSSNHELQLPKQRGGALRLGVRLIVLLARIEFEIEQLRGFWSRKLARGHVGRNRRPDVARRGTSSLGPFASVHD